MTQYGKITHFDQQSGTGMIAPQDGSEALPFHRNDLQQQQGDEPRSDQVYAFETRGDANGLPVAVNLQMQQGPNARQESAAANGNQGGFDQHGQSQARANQEAERRSGVDGAGLVQGGGEARDAHGRSEHQTRTDGQDGVSRADEDTPRGEAGGGVRPDGLGSASEGSTFQPLEAEDSKARRTPEQQHNLGRDAQGRDERA